MTTLAYKAPYLMGDGGSFHDTATIQLGTVKKVSKVPLFNGLFMYVAICGDGGTDAAINQFLSDTWRTQDLSKSLAPCLPSGAQYGVIAVMPDKTVWYINSDNNGLVDVFDAEYYTEGSGHEVAIGALANGADAVGAIQAAAKHNLYTKYPFQGYNILTGEELIFRNERDVNTWRNRLAT